MYKKIIFLIFIYTISSAQSFQIDGKSKKDLLKKAGVTEKQAKQLLKQSGLTSDSVLEPLDRKPDVTIDQNNIEKTQTGIIELYEADKSNLKNKSDPEIVESIDSGDDNDSENEKIEIITNISSATSNYFGYNVFTGDPELFQQSYNESVDPNYVIGPGDEVEVY